MSDVEARAQQIQAKLQAQINAVQAIGEAVKSAYEIMSGNAQPEMVEMANSWGGENANLYVAKLSDNLSSIFNDYNELNKMATKAYKNAINTARSELSDIGVNPDDAGLYYNGAATAEEGKEQARQDFNAW